MEEVKEKEKYYCIVSGELICMCNKEEDAIEFIKDFQNGIIVKGIKIYES